MPKHHHDVAKWVPAMLFLTAGFLGGMSMSGWIQMWIIAFGLFAAAKWITVIAVLSSKRPASIKRLFAYGFLWPGLNANQFMFDPPPPKPRLTQWCATLAKSVVGILLMLLSVGLRNSEHPLVVGWVAMFGIVFILHFGLFHLLALCWQSRGVNAQPIMNMPIGSNSLAKFWSRRWNRAFSDLMHVEVFRPLRRRFGVGAALLIVFFISGLLHESVISIPARGGYGLPTGYFLLQGLGHFGERSEFGKRIGLGHGWTGWTYVVLVAGIPTLLLFPPVFIRNVILPMLHAL
jgi:hypothetical protein